MRRGTWVGTVLLVAAALLPLAAVIVAVAMALLGGVAPEHPTVLAAKESATSPSGRYTCELAEDADGSGTVYPLIRDREGTVVWRDDQRYLMSSHPVGVVWQEDADVLWLLSSDIGSSRVVQVDGRWTKDWDWATLPPDIERTSRGSARAGRPGPLHGERSPVERQAWRSCLPAAVQVSRPSMLARGLPRQPVSLRRHTHLWRC